MGDNNIFHSQKRDGTPRQLTGLLVVAVLLALALVAMFAINYMNSPVKEVDAIISKNIYLYISGVIVIAGLMIYALVKAVE